MKLDKKELKKFIDFINTVEYSPREFFRYDLVSKYKYIHEDIKPKVNQYRLFFVAQKSISAETLTTDNFFKKIGKLNELCFSESYVNYKTNQPLVDSSFCLYFSINPSDGIKVFNSFVKRMLDEQLRAVTSINKEYSLRLFSNLEKTIKSEAHKAGNRNNKFIDIDIDVNDTYISIVEEIVKEYKENNLKFITIKNIRWISYSNKQKQYYL